MLRSHAPSWLGDAAELRHRRKKAERIVSQKVMRSVGFRDDRGMFLENGPQSGKFQVA